jgi:hypothetical protein
MLTDLRAWMGSPAVPTADDVNDLFGKITRLRTHVTEEAAKSDHNAPRLALIDAELAQIKAAAKYDAATAKVDAAQWNAKPESERRQLAARLDQLFDELRCLTREERTAGRVYFIVFCALFCALAGLYVGFHWNRWKPDQPAADRVSGQKIAAVMRELRQLELTVSDQRAKKPKEIKDEEREKVLGPLLKPIRDRVEALKKELDGIDLSFNTVSLVGTVDGEARNGALLDTSDSLSRLRGALAPDLEGLRAGFFWNDRIGRWFEIAWWAELGVLVGIVFYIAGLLGQGRFETEDIAMFWAEVIITPAVVLIIFFLFTLTGITGVNPSETSLPGNIGFAFIFGFAIRRTLGLLDTIKKRIFPDPSP